MSKAANLNRLAYFAAVVDSGSFTKAAQYLGITKAVVSQQVARLEQEVGTTLLVRTTRRLQATEAGRMFHVRCVSILREAEEALGELAQARVEPKGVLKITAPYDYGKSVIVPLLTTFTARYPECAVELNLSDKMLDLVAENMDLAIRVGWLADSSMQAKRVGSFRQLLVGRRDFADSIINMREPAELASLPFIANSALREPLNWIFHGGNDEQRSVRFKAVMTINSTPAVLEAVRQSRCLSVLPDFLVDDELKKGLLFHALPAWDLPSGGVHVVYPAARFRPPKVSAFVNMLTAVLKN